jgi:hypothetical protein
MQPLPLHNPGHSGRTPRGPASSWISNNKSYTLHGPTYLRLVIHQCLVYTQFPSGECFHQAIVLLGSLLEVLIQALNTLLQFLDLDPPCLDQVLLIVKLHAVLAQDTILAIPSSVHNEEG